jgi:NADH-quinone oxidoreductase subunit M
VVYDRLHTHEIARFEGLVNRMPLYAATFMLFTLASVGLPGTSGFVGEVLVIVGVFGVNSWVALLAATGGFLSVAYMLWLYRRVFFGALTKDELKRFPDLRANEVIAFAPLAVITVLMGVYPDLFLDPMRASVDNLIAQLNAAPASELAAR